MELDFGQRRSYLNDETMNRQGVREQCGGGIQQGAQRRTNVKRELAVEISDDQNVCIFARLILHFAYFTQYCDHGGC